MTTESAHHVAAPLASAVLLAAGAGFVDAHVYLRIAPVFVANMSGNLVRAGMAVGDADRHVAIGSILAIAAFGAGVALGSWLISREVMAGRSPRARPLLAVETMLLVLLTTVLVAGGRGTGSTLDGIATVAVVLGATSMGLQAVALRRVGTVAVSTTYGTGAIVRLAEKVALAVRHAPRETDTRRRVTIAVLASVLIAYVVGAATASLVNPSHWWLLVPTFAALLGVSRRGRG